jgi:hypothetical protein
MRLSIQDMKNWISREGRRCGLCYFHLKPDTPLLKDPPVSRRARVLAGWPPPVWVDGLPDDVVPTGDISNLEIKTKFIAIHKSANRGCASCAVILQCLEAQALDQGFTLDQDCMDDEFGLTWRLGQRKLSESSLSISLTTKAGGDTYRTGIFPMIVGYDTRYRGMYVPMKSLNACLMIGLYV